MEEYRNRPSVKLNDLQVRLAELLLISVRDKISPLFYEDLAKAIDPPMNPRNVGKNIGQVAALCHELGLPLISAKVINKNARVVGAGFYGLYAQLGIPTMGKTEKELSHAEREAIRNCKEWYRLEDYLGLHVGMPRPQAVIQPVDMDTKMAELSIDDILVESLQAESIAEEIGSFSYCGKPKKKSQPVVIQGRRTYPRDRSVAIHALMHAHFKCEINPDHPLFIRRNSECLYTEPHHLVPMAYQKYFDVSLDVEENIVSLCCTCHKHIHYGKGAEELIAQLYEERKDALKSVGIIISKEELIALYTDKEF